MFRSVFCFALLTGASPVWGQEADGLPQPSILLGLASANSIELLSPGLPPDPIASAYADAEDRAAFRRDDPLMFAAMVEAGALDPPDQLMAASIQAELGRMSCYTKSIDGIFGIGSQQAVLRYFEERGIEPPSDVPVANAELFRLIILAEDVTCPPPPVVVRDRPDPLPNRPQPPRPQPPVVVAEPDPPAANFGSTCIGCFK